MWWTNRLNDVLDARGQCPECQALLDNYSIICPNCEITFTMEESKNIQKRGDRRFLVAGLCGIFFFVGFFAIVLFVSK